MGNKHRRKQHFRYLKHFGHEPPSNIIQQPASVVSESIVTEPEPIESRPVPKIKPKHVPVQKLDVEVKEMVKKFESFLEEEVSSKKPGRKKKIE